MPESKSASNQNQADHGSSQGQGMKIQPWEKVLGWIGLVFVLGILGFLVYEAQQPDTPPEITVRVVQVMPVAGGYRVEVEAKNGGEATGAAVEIEGTLTPSDDPEAEPVETSTITLDYVPSQSTREGGLFFTENPDEYTLDVRALGYVEP